MKDKKILNTSYEETSFDIDDVKKSLTEENNFLIRLVDTIPAKMYFERDIQEKITAEKHSAMDKAAEDIRRKSSNHIQLSAKSKHKRARLDPVTQKSVSQIHDELNKKKRRKRKKKGILVPSASLTRATNIEELQKRLQERINSLQEQRKAARNDLEQRKKLKTKVKKLKVKKKGNMVKVKELNESTKSPEKKKSNKSNDKPVFNKERNFIYGKLDFTENGQEESKKNEYVGKKTKVLLKKAEIQKEKLENLKSTDPEKAELVAKKQKWKKALQKVEGVKVKDDPKLLKKTLKKEEKRKKQNAKVWKQRTDETEKRQKARQEKRAHNIKQKKKEKFDRKIKLAKKKGRVIPGF